jgi:hypothetical protein
MILTETHPQIFGRIGWIAGIHFQVQVTLRPTVNHCTKSRNPPILKYCSHYVRFEVFTAVTLKNCVFWDDTPCGSCKNRRFGGTQRLLHQVDKNR